jgi:ABC-type lipoprotein release transport system permease subunit
VGLASGEAEGPVIDVRAVGVIRDIEEIADAPEPFLLLTQAFVDRYQGEVLSVPGSVSLSVAPGSADRVVAGVQEALGENYLVTRETDDFAGRVDEAVSVEVNALWVFALAAAVTALMVVYQAMLWHGTELADSRFVRQSLGFTRRDHVIGSILRVGPALLIGVAGAVGVAIALSPLFPRGLARRADPSTGVLVDPTVLIIGAATILTVGLGLAAAAGRGRRRAAGLRSAVPPTPVAGLAGALSPARGLGLRFALAPRGRMANAGWAGIAGAAVAVAGLIAVAAVDRSADRLMTTPRLYGAGWDAVLETEPGQDVDEVDELAETVAGIPGVAGVGRAERLAGEEEAEASGPGGRGMVEPEVFHAVAGAIAPTLTEGLLPGGPSEVSIGASVAEQLGASIGDTIDVEGLGDATASYVVVGRVVTPGTDELGNGFVLTHDGLAALTEDCPAGSDGPQCEPMTAGLAVSFVPGVDHDAVITRLRDVDEGFVPVELPSIVHNLGQIGSTPWYLAAFLGLLGVAGLAHAMAVGSGRRDHDLAVTRAVGFRPAQARRAVRWQGGVLAALGSLAGVFLGVVAGRLVWQRVASGSGALIETVVPVWAMLAAPVAILGLAVLVAAVSGTEASMRRPAELLRTE